MAADLLPCAWCQRLPTVTEGDAGFYQIACKNLDCGVWPRVIMSSLAGALRQWNKRAPLGDEKAATALAKLRDDHEYHAERALLNAPSRATPATTGEDDDWTPPPMQTVGRGKVRGVVPLPPPADIDQPTPPAAPAAVTDDMVEAGASAFLGYPSEDCADGGRSVRGHIRAAIQAALAAAASEKGQ